MTEVKPSAAVEMTLLTKERPLVSEMKAWIEENLTRLPPDQRALVMGVEPQGVYAFEKATVLPALVENATTGITAPMVAARDAAIQAIVDANSIKDKRRAAFMAEVSNNLFVGLERALKPNAPLLLNKFKKSYPQGGAYAKYHDGVRAWAALEAMGKADAQLAGEAAASDARIVTYDLKRLPADATADAFSARVTDAFDNVIPYLERAFADNTAIGAWVLKQCPENYAVEARSRYAAMADKTDPHAVAAMVSDVISTAQSAKGDLVKQAMAEYVGLADDDGAYDGMPVLLGDEGGRGGGRGGGRRPGGLGRG